MNENGGDEVLQRLGFSSGMDGGPRVGYPKWGFPRPGCAADQGGDVLPGDNFNYGAGKEDMRASLHLGPGNAVNSVATGNRAHLNHPRETGPRGSGKKEHRSAAFVPIHGAFRVVDGFTIEQGLHYQGKQRPASAPAHFVAGKNPNRLSNFAGYSYGARQNLLKPADTRAYPDTFIKVSAHYTRYDEANRPAGDAWDTHKAVICDRQMRALTEAEERPSTRRPLAPRARDRSGSWLPTSRAANMGGGPMIPEVFAPPFPEEYDPDGTPRSRPRSRELAQAKRNRQEYDAQMVAARELGMKWAMGW